jgi:hypothetical protein
VTFDLEKKLGQGQGHPPFWPKNRIFGSFIKVNSELLNYFLAFSADYHNFKKNLKNPGIEPGSPGP